MSVIAEDKQYRLDWLKWLVVFTLLGGAIYANWYYSAESVLYRVIGFLVVLAIAAAVACADGERGSYYRVSNWSSNGVAQSGLADKTRAQSNDIDRSCCNFIDGH